MPPDAHDSVILGYQVWGYDDTDYRVLRNAMVVTKHSHECAICFDVIPSGSRVRTQTETYDHECKTFRFCPICCAAMVADRADGDCLHVEARTEIGRRRAEYEYTRRKDTP
jgi:hypothetical protein